MIGEIWDVVEIVIDFFDSGKGCVVLKEGNGDWVVY